MRAAPPCAARPPARVHVQLGPGRGAQRFSSAQQRPEGRARSPRSVWLRGQELGSVPAGVGGGRPCPAPAPCGLAEPQAWSPQLSGDPEFPQKRVPRVVALCPPLSAFPTSGGPGGRSALAAAAASRGVPGVVRCATRRGFSTAASCQPASPQPVGESLFLVSSGALALLRRPVTRLSCARSPRFPTSEQPVPRGPQGRPSVPRTPWRAVLTGHGLCFAALLRTRLRIREVWGGPCAGGWLRDGCHGPHEPAGGRPLPLFLGEARGTSVPSLGRW